MLSMPPNLDTPALVAATFGFLVLTAGIAVDIALLARVLASRDTLRQRMRVLRQRPWSWSNGGRILGALAVVNCALVFVVLAVNSVCREDSDLSISATILSQVVLFHGLGLAAIAASLRGRRVSWAAAFGIEPRRLVRCVGAGILCYVAAVPVLTVSGLVYRLALTAIGYEASPQHVVSVFLGPDRPLWLQLLIGTVAVVVAPFAEEVIFRGVALPLLSKRLPLSTAICAVSALFAALHFHIPSLVPLFVIAVAFSLAYIYSGNILVPIVMHAVFNAVSLAVFLALRGSPSLL